MGWVAANRSQGRPYACHNDVIVLVSFSNHDCPLSFGLVSSAPCSIRAVTLLLLHHEYPASELYVLLFFSNTCYYTLQNDRPEARVERRAGQKRVC